MSNAVAAMLYYLVRTAFPPSARGHSHCAGIQRSKGLELEDSAGLGQKYPWMGLAMLVFMLSRGSRSPSASGQVLPDPLGD
jgi:NADH:ubiquinone oxidoreductase subunit 2 (subunit N)